jgi:hypothetical protein
MNETNGNAGLARNVLRAALAVDGLMLFFALCASVNHNGGSATLLMLFLAALTGLALWYATKAGVWFVMRLEGTWQAVCSRIGFDGIGLEPLWKHGLKGRYIDKRTEVIYPKLINVRGDWNAWTAEVRFIQGQTLDEYNECADSFALAFGVPVVTFDVAESGLIRIRAGEVPIPETYEFDQLELSDDH